MGMGNQEQLYTYTLRSDDPRVSDQVLVGEWLEPDQLAASGDAAGFDRAECHEFCGWACMRGRLMYEAAL